MAVFQIDKIQQDVRVALDYNKTSDILESIDDIETLTLNEVIHSKMLEGIKRIHSEAPLHLLDGGNNFGDAVYWREDNSGWVLLPEDFMRLIVFEMSDWSRPVYMANSIDNSEYIKQSSRFRGIRGTAQLPKCFIAVRPEGRVLEFYSCKSKSAQVRRAVYVPYPSFDEMGAVNIAERCYNAAIYTIASLVLLTYGQTEKSSVFNELAKTSLI